MVTITYCSAWNSYFDFRFVLKKGQIVQLDILKKGNSCTKSKEVIFIVDDDFIKKSVRSSELIKEDEIGFYKKRNGKSKGNAVIPVIIRHKGVSGVTYEGNLLRNVLYMNIFYSLRKSLTEDFNNNTVSKMVLRVVNKMIDESDESHYHDDSKPVYVYDGEKVVLSFKRKVE